MQETPHAPQLVTEFSADSQPLAGLPSQLPKPALQAPKAQEPLEHKAEALGKLQDLPQEPQLEMEERGVSQPLAELPSQLPKPALQAPKAQEPLEHKAEALGKLQDLPQEPQLEMEERGVSQPLAGLPSQLPKPALQAPKAQEPLEHKAEALGKLQDLPQEPQLEMEERGVSQPLAELPSQLPKPALQAPKAQEPLEHKAEALGKLQDLPQEPQLEMEERGVSQPLAGLPSQLPKPALQGPKAQEPLEHKAEALGKAARPATRAAVGDGGKRSLAAIGRVAVAVAKAGVASPQSTGTARAQSGGIGETARPATRAAVGDGIDGCFAAVSGIVVTIFESSRAALTLVVYAACATSTGRTDTTIRVTY